MLLRFRLFLLWTITAVAGDAAEPVRFRAPADVSPPFRREGLPLDLDTQGSLSRQLTVLGVAAASAKEPAERRAAAQFLALATSLDPGNRAAREAITQCASGWPPSAPPVPQRSTAMARAWNLWTWLASEEAGADGQAFAACLGDALAVVDAKHPKAETLRKEGERGKWTGWVASLTEFGATAAPPKNPDDSAVAKTNQDPPADDPPAADGDKTRGATILLKEVEVATPLYYYDPRTEKHASGLVTTQLRASITRNPSEEGQAHAPFQLNIAGVGIEEAYRLDKARANLLAVLTEAHGPLPAGGVANLSIDDKIHYSITSNEDAITGPAAVLLDAALTGKPPAKDLIVLGRLGSDGKFAMPRGIWPRLRMLEQGSAGRLIVPKAAADLLIGMLVLEQPGFFLNHEVIVADTFTELVDRARVAEHGPYADALAKFAEIRKFAEGRSPAQFAAHPSTRQRLAEVAQLFPDHLSARMLLLQGGGTRPTTFPTSVLARELRRSLKPVGGLPTAEKQGLSAAACEAAHEQCRKELDQLTTRVDSRDRQLHDQALAVANTLRTLGRKLRSAAGNHDSSWSIFDTAVRPIQRQLAADYATLMEKLDELTGEDEYRVPKPAAP